MPRVRRGAAVVGIVMAALIAWQLLRLRELYTRTNNAGPSGPALTVTAPQQACLDLTVPGGTGRLRVEAVARGGIAAQLRPGGSAAVQARPGPGSFTTFEIATRPVRSATMRTLCIKPEGSVQLAGRP